MSRAGAVRGGAVALLFLACIIGGIAALTVTPAAAAVSKAMLDYDIFIGDSYAAGYQPVKPW